MTTLLLQLSDLHIREPYKLAYGRIETAPYLQRAIESILELPQQPDAVVITGDLTDFGRAAEYAHLRDLLGPLSMPVYLMPGNHDDRTQLRQTFRDHDYLGTDGFVQFSIAVGALQLIALDTVVPNKSSGSLCAKRLIWLHDALEKSRNRPVVIAMHHPPFQTLIGHMDVIGLLQGASELEALVAQYPNIERIICGHLHRSIQVRFGGSIASTAPSPAHQVCLDLSAQAASSWNLEPPGFVLHALPVIGRLVTHTAAIGQYPGPYSFYEAGALID